MPALKDFPKEDSPEFARRVLVVSHHGWDGGVDDRLGICSAWLRYRRRLYHSRPFQWFALCMGPAGLIAAGRRVGDHRGGPPAVGDLRVAAHRDAVSLHSTLQMAISLLVFIVVYCAVFGVGYYYIFRLIKKGRSR